MAMPCFYAQQAETSRRLPKFGGRRSWIHCSPPCKSIWVWFSRVLVGTTKLSSNCKTPLISTRNIAMPARNSEWLTCERAYIRRLWPIWKKQSP